MTATRVYAAQKAYVRGARDAQVAAIVDALADAGGTLSVTALGERAGIPAHRVAGVLVTVQRLLNVESYPVLGVIDGNTTARLDVRLLREQFGLDADGSSGSGSGSSSGSSDGSGSGSGSGSGGGSTGGTA